MSDPEIIQLIGRLQKGEGSDEEIGQWLQQLQIAIPCPHLSDLIFYGDPSDTAESILAKAREYRPIRL